MMVGLVLTRVAGTVMPRAIFSCNYAVSVLAKQPLGEATATKREIPS